MSNKPATPNLPPSVALTLRINPQTSRLLLVLLLFPLALLINWLAAPPISQLEERLSEQRWVAFPKQQTEQRFLVLTIDEASLKELGAWPWSRTTLAQISAKLQAAGAALQIYDLLLPEAKPGDKHLAAQLAQTPSVLGMLPVLQSNQKLQTGQLSQGLLNPSCTNTTHPLPKTDSYLANAPAYTQQTQGHLAPLVDTDGVIRKQPPLICINGQAYPSLTLAALLTAENPPATQTSRPQLSLEKGQGLLAPAWWLKTTSNSAKLPLDKQGNLRLSYHQAPDNFTTLSVADLLKNNYPAQLLDNAWVLIGATAFGLADVVPTPHAALTPGVELQARLLTDLLDQNHSYQPQGAWLIQLTQLLISSALLLLLASRRQHNVTLLATAALLLPLAHLLGHWLLISANLWVAWFLPALYSSLTALSLLLIEFARTRFERQRLYQNLSSYLPQGIADQIAFRKTSDQVEGNNQQLLVAYANLRNFSGWQAHLPAEETAALLNYFYITASQTLAQHGGTLHEFRGDALLAAWPITNKNTPAQTQQAIQAIHTLQTSLKSLLEAPPHPNLQPLGLDFGLDTGPVLIGSLGSAQRRSHLLLGQTINRVIGIQQMTAEIGSTLLLSETLAKSLSPKQTMSQGNYLLEGFTRPQHLYTLKNPNPSLGPKKSVLQLHPLSG